LLPAAAEIVSVAALTSTPTSTLCFAISSSTILGSGSPTLNLARRVQPLLVSRKALLTEIALPMRQRGGIAVVVDDENHPIGVLTADDLTRAARSVEHDRRATAPHSI
jgi:CBS domain-containing protein